jgi:hypothetical protein
MILQIDHLLGTRARAAVLCASLAAAAALTVAPSAPAAGTRAGAAAAGRGAGSAGSQYPAGAERPALVVARGQLPRRAAATAGAAATHRRSRVRRKRAKPVLRGNPARALTAFQAMQQQYYIAGSGLYAGEPFSYLWPFSQALAAAITLANVPVLAPSMGREVQARLVGLRSYFDANNSGAPEGTYTSTLPAYDGTVAPPAGPGGPKYYDDNDWVGIELARLYRVDRNAAVLATAQAIMAFEMAGWQTNPELACAGGIPFSNIVENSDRNTVTVAPAAELALQLYTITGNSQYLQFAEMAYEWVRRCLLNPEGLYSDHISPLGAVEPMLWSYNQGTMIGAGTMLYQATGNAAFLYQARQTAKAALAYFTPERLELEIPFFATVYFRNLLYLDSVTHDPSGRRSAQAYVDNAWQNLRLGNNVFVAGSPATAQLLVQSAIVQIYGLLSSQPRSYF